MPKSDKRKIRAVLHPDRARDEAERKRLDQASQIFNALPIKEIDDG